MWMSHHQAGCAIPRRSHQRRLPERPSQGRMCTRIQARTATPWCLLQAILRETPTNSSAAQIRSDFPAHTNFSPILGATVASAVSLRAGVSTASGTPPQPAVLTPGWHVGDKAVSERGHQPTPTKHPPVDQQSDDGGVCRRISRGPTLGSKHVKCAPTHFITRPLL